MNPVRSATKATTEGAVVIPRWFVSLIACCILLLGPWLSWATYRIITFEVRQETQKQALAEIAHLRAEISAHLLDKEVHRIPLNELRLRIEHLEKRAEQLRGPAEDEHASK